MIRLKSKEDRTSDCCNSLGWIVIRGERLIKLGYSWFSVKPILVGQYNKQQRGKVTLWSWRHKSLAHARETLKNALFLYVFSQSKSAKVLWQEGNNPERHLRSLIGSKWKKRWSTLRQSQDQLGSSYS